MATTAVQILTSGGILRAAEVADLAAAAGLELAAAATLLQKESGGGRNVWGHDPVQTGGTYVKGAEVTKAAYLAYKTIRTALGAQGVGPCQLTWRGYQDQADAIGGCWDWRANCTVGFRTLAALIKTHGIRNGFRGYNGSGPAAEAYADDALVKLARWRSRLGPQLPAPAAGEQEDDVNEQDVWNHPIDDAYTDKAGDTVPAFAALAWATANAGFAARDAAAALAGVARVEAKLDQLLGKK